MSDETTGLSEEEVKGALEWVDKFPGNTAHPETAKILAAALRRERERFNSIQSDAFEWRKAYDRLMVDNQELAEKAEYAEARVRELENKYQCFVCLMEDELGEKRFTQSHPIECIDNWFRKQSEWDDICKKYESSLAAERKKVAELRAAVERVRGKVVAFRKTMCGTNEPTRAQKYWSIDFDSILASLPPSDSKDIHGQPLPGSAEDINRLKVDYQNLGHENSMLKARIDKCVRFLDSIASSGRFNPPIVDIALKAMERLTIYDQVEKMP